MTIEELEDFGRDIALRIHADTDPPPALSIASAVAVIGTEICRRLDDIAFIVAHR